MHKRTILQLAALGLIAVSGMGASGCPLIPEVHQKAVELAVGGSTAADFAAEGEINFHNDVEVVDLAAGLDLASVIDDAGIDVSKVKDIKVSGVSYRTTRPDPTPNRRIVDGSVTIARGAGAPVSLVDSFQADVNAATSFQTAPLNPAGVALLNDLVADLLNELKTGTPAGNTTVTIHVTGASSPTNVPTDFEYQLKLDVSIVGTVDVDVVE